MRRLDAVMLAPPGLFTGHVSPNLVPHGSAAVQTRPFTSTNSAGPAEADLLVSFNLARADRIGQERPLVPPTLTSSVAQLDQCAGEQRLR